MDNELKTMLGEIKTSIAEQSKIKAAVEQLEEQMRGMPKTIENKLNAVRSISYDDRGRYRGLFETEDDARCFGLCLMHQIGGSAKALDALKGEMKSVFERALGGTSELGDGVVPIEFSRRIQRLVEDAGVLPRNCFNLPMQTDKLTFQRRTQGLTVFKTGMNIAATASELGFETINLNADTWRVLCLFPKELDADSAGVIGEMVLIEIVQAFAEALDTYGFGGDGTPDSLDIEGITAKLKRLNGVDDGGGLCLGSGNAWSEIARDDFQKVIGTVPGYAHANAKWYCSMPFWATVMLDIILDGGGVTAAEMANGQRQMMFLGYPVEICHFGLPKTEGNSQVCALFGDLRLSTTHGVREQMTIEESRHVRFLESQVAVMGCQRHDINNHSLGDADTAGAVVGLITAAG
jgi:HK97 family phage major capsid protein